MDSKPQLISVIVSAYKRKKYLPYALRSLESQTLPKDKFGIIIVKNFKDKKTEEIIEEMNG